MSKLNRKGIPKMFTLYPQQNDFVNFAVENKGAASASEIIRWALDEYKKSHYPDYVWKLTPAATQKLKKMDEIQEAERIRNLSVEDFAKEHQVEILLDKEGNKHAFMYEFANDALRSPNPDWMKEKLISDPEWLDVHLTKCKAKPVMEKLLENRKEYEARGIIFPVALKDYERNQRDNP